MLLWDRWFAPIRLRFRMTSDATDPLATFPTGPQDLASAKKERAEEITKLEELRGDKLAPTQIRNAVVAGFKNEPTVEKLVEGLDTLSPSDAKYAATLEQVRIYYMYLKSKQQRQ